MGAHLISLTILFFALFVQASKKPLPENIYPSWFLEPPAGRANVTVGYSDVRAYLDSAIASATREAAVNCVRNQQVRIAGEQGLATLAVGTLTVGSTISEGYDESAAGQLSTNLKVLDYFQRAGAATVLASTDSSDAAVNARRVDVSKVPRPSWTTTIPEKAGYMYNSGLCPVYYNENNSWREAERRGRINLALTLYTKVKFMGKKADDSYFREFQVEETNATLRGVEIVARWKDVKNQICYVLVRMPVAP
ncbi:MAG TPA: hypothetical protein VMM37_01565 [Bacteroidota bacterium]|nr:hypothetical protein [Bacteroidota bacterium]